jgi:hypothetical protein
MKELQFFFIVVVKGFRALIPLEELALKSIGTDIAVFHIIII